MVRAAFLLGTSIVVGLGAATFGMEILDKRQTNAPLDAGRPFVEISPEVIPWLVYSNPTTTVMAQRIKPGGDFAVQAAFSGPRGPEHCTSSSTLDGILPMIALVKVKRQISKQDLASDFPIQLGTVELKGFVAGDPPLTMRYFASREGNAVAAEQDAVAFLTGVPPEVFRKLAAGCEALKSH